MEPTIRLRLPYYPDGHDNAIELSIDEAHALVAEISRLIRRAVQPEGTPLREGQFLGYGRSTYGGIAKPAPLDVDEFDGDEDDE